MSPIDQAREVAQQKHAGGTRLVYFHTDESVGPNQSKATVTSEKETQS
jgi:hypothetical protein